MGGHTAGPWHVTDVSGNEGESEIIEAKHRGIAWTNDSWDEVKQQGYISQEDRANARLIAAAPDLLAALEDVVKSAQAMMHPVAWMGESLANAITAAEEAIAKAKGGE